MNENCPLCFSSNTKKSREGYSSRIGAGKNYINSLKFKNIEIIDKEITFYVCKDCGTGWRDNSNLSKSIDHIYHDQHSLHWKSFQIFKDIIVGNNFNSHIQSFQKLALYYFNFLQKDLDIIEIGSPILGFGFQLSDLTKIRSIKSHSRKNYKIFSLLLLQEKFTYLLIFIFKTFNLFKKLFKKILRKKSIKKVKFNQISSIKFYDIPTTIGWGTSSVICGHSTLKWLLHLNPKVELINRYTAHKASADLSICINYLDHFDSPTEIIREMLLISKIMIFNIHKQADAAIQHKFTYADDFSKTITDILKEPYLCLQITEDIIKLKDQFKYNFFIVGEKDFVNDYIKFLRNLKLSN